MTEDESKFNTEKQAANPEQKVEQWETEFREELRPVLDALRGIIPALEMMAENPKYHQILAKLQLEPRALSSSLAKITDALDKSLGYIIRDSGGSRESAERNFQLRFFSGANFSTITQIFRLDAIIRSYAARYAGTQSNDTPTTGVNIEGMIALNQEGQRLIPAVKQLRDALASSLGVNMHEINFLQQIEELDRSKTEESDFLSPLSQVPETCIWNWPGGLDKYNNTVADVSFWGRDNKKFPEFNAKTRIHGWWR